MIGKKRASALQMIRGTLLQQGLTLTDFANLHGFEYDTVVKTIRRHWGKSTKPWGKTSNAILQALKNHCHGVSSFSDDASNDHSGDPTIATNNCAANY